MKFLFIKNLENWLQDKYSVVDICVDFELCPVDFSGDITINCFVLARKLRRNPMQIASDIVGYLSGDVDVEFVECIKAFVNVTLSSGALFRDTVADEGALLADVLLPMAERRKVLIEYSAPNTNKPQHLGHVRNNTLGMTLASIFARVGHEVVPVNLVNDRGIHICKSMIAYQRFGNGETPDSSSMKGDHLVGKYYVRFDKEFRKQADELRAKDEQCAGLGNDELFLRTEIGRATQEMLVAWENGDKEVRELWKMMNGWVFAGFEETYAKMGIVFERTYLESETYGLGKDIIERGLADGVFKRREDGAVIIDLSEKKLAEKVVLRSDGTSVYVTQDIGTTMLKYRDYKPDSMIWVVGDEQIYHFRVLFEILRALGNEWADNLFHLAYGMVNLPSGKMKSREGTVVDADDLFARLEQLAREATVERYAANIPDNLDERAAVIGMGALKFILQKVNPKTTMMFDPDAAIKFEGDTGPYVLYAYARISSMLRKAGDEIFAEEVNWQVLGNKEERDLALRCSLFGGVMRRAACEYDSSVLANYLLGLAKAFSRFYGTSPVLAAESVVKRRARLELSARVRCVLKDGLSALTIDTLESM